MIPVGHKTKTNLREPEAADIKVKSLKQFIKVVSDQMFCCKTDNKEFRLFFHQKHLFSPLKRWIYPEYEPTWTMCFVKSSFNNIHQPKTKTTSSKTQNQTDWSPVSDSRHRWRWSMNLCTKVKYEKTNWWNDVICVASDVLTVLTLMRPPGVSERTGTWNYIWSDLLIFLWPKQL